MPIFQEPFDQDDAGMPQSAEAELEAETPTPRNLPGHGPRDMLSQRITGSSSRRISESFRTELCDGPIPDKPPSSDSTPLIPELPSNTTSDRIELIERLKRGESPTWSPKRHVRSRHRFQSVSELSSILTDGTSSSLFSVGTALESNLNARGQSPATHQHILVFHM